MNFTVSNDVFAQFPELAVGVIVTTGIDNNGHFEEVTTMLRSQEEAIRNSLDIETYRDHPHLAALQEVHRSFGNNPNKYPPSVQALVKRLLKGGQLPDISPIVDLYNIVSLKHIVCAGAEDIDVCEGDIQLAYADGTEHFLPLGSNEEDPPKEGELVYKDDVGVICRKLNWREADRTKITPETKSAVVVLEGFPPFSQEQLNQALEELAGYLQQYCQAQIRIEVLTASNPQCNLR